MIVIIFDIQFTNITFSTPYGNLWYTSLRVILTSQLQYSQSIEIPHTFFSLQNVERQNTQAKMKGKNLKNEQKTTPKW